MMSDKDKLIAELSEKVTEKIVSRLQSSTEGMKDDKSEDCTNGYACGSIHTCTSNEFGCDSFVCENDFAG